MRTAPGYDYIIQGMSGLMSITGDPAGQPQKVGVAVTDVFTGVYSAVAILAAVHQRGATGMGQHIDMALVGCGHRNHCQSGDELSDDRHAAHTARQCASESGALSGLRLCRRLDHHRHRQ